MKKNLYLLSLPFRWIAVTIGLIAALPVIITLYFLKIKVWEELEEILREEWF